MLSARGSAYLLDRENEWCYSESNMLGNEKPTDRSLLMTLGEAEGSNPSAATDPCPDCSGYAN